jgi:transglutaminase-like putative cysteine protease
MFAAALGFLPARLASPAAAPDFVWPDWDALARRHPGAPAVLLLDETISELGYFGSVGVDRKVEERRIVAVLDPAGAAGVLEGEVADTPIRKLLAIDGRIWTSAKQVRRLDKRDFPADSAAPATGGRGARTRTYRLRDVPARSVVELRIVHIRPSLYSYDEHLFAARVPTEVSRVRLVIPRHLVTRDLTRSVRAYGPVGRPSAQLFPRPAGEVREFSWELRDLDTLPQEPRMPSPSEVVAAMWVAPPSPELPSGSWEEAGRECFDRFLAPRLAGTAALHALAERLAPAGAGTLERVRALHGYVEREIRTVSGGLDALGFEPQSPGAVLEARQGAGLDKACLLVALLRESGIEAALALCRGRTAGPADTSFLNLGQLDRALVWVPLGPDGWWMDPAVPCPAEYLPAEDQGVVALVLAPGFARLTETPVLPPEASALERRLSATLDDAGALEGTVELRATGEQRIALQSALWGRGEDLQRDLAAGLLERFVGPARLRGFRVAEPRGRGGPFLVALDFVWPAAARVVGDTLELPEGFVPPPEEWSAPFEARTRVLPVVFEGLEQRRDRLRIQPPPGFAAEPAEEVGLRGRWFSTFQSAVSDSAGHGLDRTLEISQWVVASSDLGAARGEVESLAAACRRPIRFHRVR